jgi:hypothetical protein
MTRRILRTSLIVTLETALLLLLAASWGILARRPAASTRSDGVPTFEGSMQTGGVSVAASSRGHEIEKPFKPGSAHAVSGPVE